MKQIKRLLFVIFIFVFILKIIDIFLYNYVNDNSSETVTDFVEELGSRYNLDPFDQSVVDYTILHKGETLPEKTKKRILVIGDSFVYGYGATNTNTLFWNKLEYILKINGYNDVEIVAAGLSAYGTYDEVELIYKGDTIKNVDPDLIILAMYDNAFSVANLNDELGLKWYNKSRVYNEISSKFIIKISSFLFPNLTEIFINKRIDMFENSENYDEKYGSIYGYTGTYINEFPKQNEKYIDAMDKSLEYIKNFEIPTLIYRIFDYNGYDVLFDSVVDQLLSKNGLEIYRTYDNHEEELKKYDSLYWVNSEEDAHSAEKMNTMYAEDIYDILINDYSEYIGDKTEIKEFELIINDYVPYSIDLKKIDDNTYKFIYPSKDEFNLTYILDDDYVKLNFKYPVKLEKVVITGDNIKNVSMYINQLNDNKNYIKIDGDNGFDVSKIDDIFSLNILIDLIDEKGNREFIINLE